MKRAGSRFLILMFLFVGPLLREPAHSQSPQGSVSYPFIPEEFRQLPNRDTILDVHRDGSAIPDRPRSIAAGDSTNQARSDRGLARTYYFYEPYPMEPGSFFWQIGASISLVPLAEAEQEYPMPGLDVQCKWGLLGHTSFAASYSTSYYSHLFHTGLQWSQSIDRFSWGIGNHVGIAYGHLKNVNLFDDVEAHGFFDMPLIRVGYRFDDFSISCSFVMTYVFESDSRVNGSKAFVGPEKSINDYYFTWVVEQPFLRNVHLSIGLSMGYARTPYQSWMQYNTTDEWLFVPEFFFAIQM